MQIEQTLPYHLLNKLRLILICDGKNTVEEMQGMIDPNSYRIKNFKSPWKYLQYKGGQDAGFIGCFWREVSS